MPFPLESLNRNATLTRLVMTVHTLYRHVGRFGAPALDLLTRLWLAQAFFLSGVLKAANWDNALYLATHEYPVPWLDPVTAAWMGVVIEIGGALLLAAGLSTRLAALALLALTVVTHLNYVAIDINLLSIVILGWLAMRGAGIWSVDHAIAPGLAASPLPFAATGARALSVVTRYVEPVYVLVLRLWIALTLVVTLLAPAMAEAMTHWLAFQSAARLPPALAMTGAVLLAAGVLTRPMSVLLVLGVMAVDMMDPSIVVDLHWILLFGLLTLRGAGVLSVDALAERLLCRLWPRLEGKAAFALDGLPRVVIVGAGFGGLTCAARLCDEPVAVTLIDRHNYHLFQPLLYQVATASLSPGDIATPIRGLFRDSFNTRVLYGEVTGVDTQLREVVCGPLRIPYDYLVLATGASHSYFGKDEWGAFAPGLKRIEDATEVRRRVLSAFELAEASEDETERRTLLNFIVVGGGPTGVELAGAIAEMAHHGMEKDFRRIDPAQARVMLVQSGGRILPSFPEDLSEHARQVLEKMGVEVLLGSRVEMIDAGGVTVSGQRIPARTVLWAAGVVASPAARWLKVMGDAAGRVKVAPDLSVPQMPEVFCIGDTALSLAWNGQAVPGLAPAAKQGGAYVAQVIRARVHGRPAPGAFVYRHLGSLATIGRKSAVADFGFVRISGAPAWWLWGLVHVGFLVGMRSRISVMLDWFWSYLTLRGGTRLITGRLQEKSVAQPASAAPVSMAA